jgi:tetratricopeptide (TPR) repeat protein
MRRSILVVLTAAASLGRATSAPAAPPAAAPSRAAFTEAGERFRRGVKLYGEADYVAALAEFRRAHALAPAPLLLFNIAVTCRQLQNHAEALRAFVRYLDEAPTGSHAEEARQQVADLRTRVAWLEPHVDVAGVEVFVDGESVGRPPLTGPVAVNAGRRQLSVEGSAYEPLRMHLDVAGGETRSLHLTPVRRAKPAEPSAARAASAAPRARVGSRVPWVGLGVTGAAAGAAAAAGVIAYGQATRARDRVVSEPPSDADEGRRQRARTWAVAADVLAGAALISAGVTTYRWVSGAPTETPRPQAAWRLDVGPGGALVEARF